MTAPAQNENRKAAIMMIGAMGAFAFEDLFLKQAAGTMPPGQVLVMNGLIGGFTFVALALRNREPVFSLRALRGIALVRNLAEAVAAYTYLYALAVVPLALVAALLQATPLVVTAGAALFLGETVGWRRWSAIIAGFIGVLIILDPWSSGFSLTSIALLFSVAALALRDLVTRRLPADLGTMSVSAWGVLASVPAGFALMWTHGTSFAWLDGASWTLLLSAVCFGVIGYYMVIEAMRIGEVSAVAPFRYSRLVFAVILAMIFLGESLTLNVIIGSAVVILSGVYMFARARIRKARLPEEALPR